MIPTQERGDGSAAIGNPLATSSSAGVDRSRVALTRGVQLFLLYALMVILGLVFIVPYIWLFGASFKTPAEIFRFVTPLSWRTFVPQDFTLDNYTRLMELKPYPFTRYLMNSIFVSTTVTVLSLIANALGAYAFARLKFPGRDALFALFLAMLILPFEVLAIPLYLVVRAFGWVDTFAALIIPCLANPLGIFLLRQFFMDIPKDLEDAARIDGASYLGAFRHVVLPNSVPALIAFALIRFQTSWDSFVWPLIAAPAPEVRVIQVAIATFTTEIQVQWGLTFAASVLATVPIILLFLFLQRYYVQGMMMSGVKG